MFTNQLDLHTVIHTVQTRGYYFVDQAINPVILANLLTEINRLPLEVGDHNKHPLQPGTLTEVRQQHARFYRMTDDPLVPAAREVCMLARNALAPLERELESWLLNEVGYQCYRGPEDWISPHRDRQSDRFMALTITITGSAWVRMYRAETDPVDYRRITLTDEHLTQPCTVLFLRAPGLGSGEQVIHEVMPPLVSPRRIVNLRMRSRLLASPHEDGSYRPS